MINFIHGSPILFGVLLTALAACFVILVVVICQNFLEIDEDDDNYPFTR